MEKLTSPKPKAPFRSPTKYTAMKQDKNLTDKAFSIHQPGKITTEKMTILSSSSSPSLCL